MQRFLLLFVLSVAMSLSAVAEGITISASVKDKMTQRKIPVVYSLYKGGADSVFSIVKDGAGGRVNILLTEWNPDDTYKLILTGAELVERVEGNTTVFSYIPTEEYIDETVIFKIPASAEKIYELSDVGMSRFRKINLGEVSVTASKVMFYHKGDTLIYNADAFILPDGSMLDALLKQMPGVELRSGGEIFCNGKKIDNLLLNGRDLFNGNRELMLENLGAYTVKDIAVYDKRDRMSDLLGKNVGKPAHVMDVRLKRQYAQGYLLNVEGGYGTKERYLAKLFGMWMSENVSVSAYAGANNLSDQQKPGMYDGAWSVNRSQGVSTQRQGGLMYDAHGYANKWEMKGSVDVSHSNPVMDTKTVTQRYSTTGNSYQYGWRQSEDKDLNISTSHELFFKLGTAANLELRPRFTYSTKKTSRASVSADFRKEIKDLSLEHVLGLSSGDESLTSALMNRLIDADTLKSRKLSPAIDAKLDIKLRNGSNPNALTVEGSALYERGHDRQFNRYSLDYGSQTQAGAAYQRYYKHFPDFNVKWNIGTRFTQYLDYYKIAMALLVKSSYDRKRRTRYLYQSEYSTGEESGTAVDISGPYDLVPDMSYHYVQTDKKQTVMLSAQNGQGLKMLSKMMAILRGSVWFDVYSQSLMYFRGDVPTQMKRDVILPNCSFEFSMTEPKPFVWMYGLGFNYKVVPIDMLMLVDKPSMEPLNLYLGNPDLKDLAIYSFNLSGSKYGARSRQSFRIDFNMERNAIDNTCIIDPVTGQQTIQPFNVSGNKLVSAMYNLFTPFGRMQQFNVTTDTKLNYRHTVGYLGDNVDNYGAEEKFKLGWQNGRVSLAALANVRFDRYLHSDVTYDDFSAWSCSYGAEAVFNLPKDWSLSTDMSLYTRRGFADQRANTTDFVWNARLSKSILKGSLLFVVDGFDILHQLKSVTYSVNAQARTEIRYNTIPSYVLFHIQYRINKRPKAAGR